MPEQDVESLVKFGLTVLQAKAYVSLLKLGSTHASEIGSAIGTVRPETYRVLRELSEKGFVERSPGSPSIFNALHPNRTIPLLVMGFHSKYAEARKKQKELIQSLSSYTFSDDRKDRFALPFATVDSNEEKHILMIKQTRRDYAAIVSKFGLKVMGGEGVFGDDYVDVIRRANRRKVRIRMISDIDESNIEQARLICRYVELRGFRDVLFYIHIFDKREMTIGPASLNEETAEKYVRTGDLWTNNSRFIQGMYAMFEKLWDGSSKFDS